MTTEPQPVPAQPAQTVTAAPIPRPPAPLGERYGHWLLALVVFLLALLPRLTSLDAFLTADEDDQIRFAASFLEAVRTQDWARAALLGYPGVPTMAFGALGLWIRFWLHQWGISPLPDNPSNLAAALATVQQYPLVYIPAARTALAVMAALAVLAMY